MKYIDHLPIVLYTITGFLFISAFACLVAITIRIWSFEIGLKTCAITAENKKK